MSKPSLLALMLGKPKSSDAPRPAKKKSTSRDDLKVAVRDFRNAKDDDAALSALLNFRDLASGYERD